MNIETVTYFKTFPIGACWEKIGVSVKVNEGDSLTDILNQARKEVEVWHINSNPQIYTNGVRTIPDGSLPIINRDQLTEKSKPEPDIIILKKYDNAVKDGDWKTKKEIEDNYNIL